MTIADALPSVAIGFAAMLLINGLILLLVRLTGRRRSRHAAESVRRRGKRIATGIAMLLFELLVFLGFLFALGYPLAMAAMEPSYRHAFLEGATYPNMYYWTDEVGNRISDDHDVGEWSLSFYSPWEKNLPWAYYMSIENYFVSCVWAVYDQNWNEFVSIQDASPGGDVSDEVQEHLSLLKADYAKEILAQFDDRPHKWYRPVLQNTAARVRSWINSFFKEWESLEYADIPFLPYPSVPWRQQIKELFHREYTFAPWA